MKSLARPAYKKAFIICIVTFVYLLAYVLLQHYIREGLNHPQLELARDAQEKLEKGLVQPVDIVGRGEYIDIAESEEPFIAIYDESGNELEANARLGTSTLHIPNGVFQSAKVNGQDILTWQPLGSTRIALVVLPLHIESGWFVASGRNMQNGEAMIGRIGSVLLLTYLLIVFFIFSHSFRTAPL